MFLRAKNYYQINLIKYLKQIKETTLIPNPYLIEAMLIAR